MANALLDRIKKASKLEYASALSNSKILGDCDIIKTQIPALNVCFTGKLDGGLTSGLTMFAGQSSSFKSNFALVCVKAYLDKYEDAVCLFYDSEMGSSLQYFESLGIDTSRVLHLPVTNIEELKFDLIKQLEEIKRGEHAIIVIDSVGNLASKKEVDDTLAEKSSADLTRAKQYKSLVRMCVPILSLKNLPMVVVNHTYDSMDAFAMGPLSQKIGGGHGWYYGCQNIFITSKSQEKKGTDLVGFNFIINILKSRFSRERTKVPITVTFDGGINKWSALLDFALEAGVVVKPSNGWYQKIDPETGEVLDKKYRASETNTEEFWASLLECKQFTDWVENNYQISHNNLLVEGEEVNNKPSEQFIAEGMW